MGEFFSVIFRINFHVRSVRSLFVAYFKGGNGRLTLTNLSRDYRLRRANVCLVSAFIDVHLLTFGSTGKVLLLHFLSLIVLTYDPITDDAHPMVKQPLWNKSQRQSHFSWRPSRDHCFWVAANFRFRWPHDFRVSHATALSAHVDYHRVTGQWSKRSLIPREMWTRAQRNSNFPEAINVSDCGSQTRLRLISNGWQITLHIRVFAVPTLRAARRCRHWPALFVVWLDSVVQVLTRNFRYSRKARGHMKL